MIYFILYVLSGLLTTYATAIATHVNKDPVKLDDVIVWAAFWPYTIAATLYVLTTKDKEE